MTAAAETGRAGERAATEYLRRAGYEICALNWRQGRYELDIVACREGVLEWVPKEKVTQLPIWEGDKIFFRLLAEDAPFFCTAKYIGVFASCSSSMVSDC